MGRTPMPSERALALPVWSWHMTASNRLHAVSLVVEHEVVKTYESTCYTHLHWELQCVPTARPCGMLRCDAWTHGTDHAARTAKCKHNQPAVLQKGMPLYTASCELGQLRVSELALPDCQGICTDAAYSHQFSLCIGGQSHLCPLDVEACLLFCA